MRRAGHMAIERTERRRRRGRGPFTVLQASRDRQRHQIPTGCGLHVSLDSGDLAGEEQPRLGAEGKIRGHKSRVVDERVSVNLAQSEKLRLAEPGNLAEYSFLLRPGKPRLEADQVVRAGGLILHPQLNDRMWTAPSAGILQTHRLHRTKCQYFLPPLRHYLDRQTTLEISRLLEVMRRHLLRRAQRGHEGDVLLARHRQIEG